MHMLTLSLAAMLLATLLGSPVRAEACSDRLDGRGGYFDCLDRRAP